MQTEEKPRSESTGVQAWICWATCSSRLWSLMISWIKGRIFSPSGVSLTPFLDLTKTGKPSSVSSWLTEC